MSSSGLEPRLREKSLRVTAPRLAVLAAVHEHPHADTDALARVVRSRLGSVSHQTLYDVLHILTEVGQSPCLHAGDDHGFEVDEAEVVYWGTCPDCLTTSSASELPREGIR
jgi:Fe2+ or Zn2+ uptake regulation protein